MDPTDINQTISVTEAKTYNITSLNSYTNYDIYLYGGYDTLDGTPQTGLQLASITGVKTLPIMDVSIDDLEYTVDSTEIIITGGTFTGGGLVYVDTTSTSSYISLTDSGGVVTKKYLTEEQLTEIKNGTLTTDITISGLDTNEEYTISASIDSVFPEDLSVTLAPTVENIFTTDVRPPVMMNLSSDKTTYEKGETAVFAISFANVDDAKITAIEIDGTT